MYYLFYIGFDKNLAKNLLINKLKKIHKLKNEFKIQYCTRKMIFYKIETFLFIKIEYISGDFLF